MQLSEIATIQAGYPFRGKIPEVAKGEVVVIQMRDIVDGQIIQWPACARTTLRSKRDTDWLKPGDLLVAARGSHYYAVQVDSHEENQAVAAPHFFVVRVQKESILPAYLGWLINQRPCQRYLEQNAEGTLTKSIRRNVLGSLPIAVPTLERQRNLVGLVDALQQERVLLHRQLENNLALQSALAADLLSTSPGRIDRNGIIKGTKK
ncbi:MAG: restriction endonuclease subunit S [Nitrosomonas sp.]|nr:restriction endonuclease subunit S [Nitrosomonas sp.]MCW5607303.1 restriction endonuclease subunit S [Nitrosomonas sp.]